jgi:hypothetical protein
MIGKDDQIESALAKRNQAHEDQYCVEANQLEESTALVSFSIRYCFCERRMSYNTIEVGALLT